MGLTPGDIRLTNIYNFRPFSIVKDVDEDYARYAGISPDFPNDWDQSSTHMANMKLWDNDGFNVLIADPEDNNNSLINHLFGIGDPLLPDETLFDDDVIFYYRSDVYDTRYTDVYASDQVYTCGSYIGEMLDFWASENPVHGLSMGKNGDFRFIDWEVFPTDDIGLKVETKNLKVEQTSQIEIQVEPAPQKAHWEDDVYYPDERVYIYLKDTEGPDGVEIYEDFRVITPDNPLAVFQFTPYRGTCNADNTSYGWKKIFANNRFNIPYYALEKLRFACRDFRF